METKPRQMSICPPGTATVDGFTKSGDTNQGQISSVATFPTAQVSQMPSMSRSLSIRPFGTASDDGCAKYSGGTVPGDGSTAASSTTPQMPAATIKYAPIPKSTGATLNFTGVNLVVGTRKLPHPSPADIPVETPEDNDMYRITSANFFADITGENYLALPRYDSKGQLSKWTDNDHPLPSFLYPQVVRTSR